MYLLYFLKILTKSFQLHRQIWMQSI